MRKKRRPRALVVSSINAKSIGILLIPGFALLAYASTVEPLRAANRISGCQLYKWRHITPKGSPVAASNGAMIIADEKVGASDKFDILFVCAGEASSFGDRNTLAWLRSMARRGVALCGVSGGSFVLAKAGLLAGYRCTIHWEFIPAFQEMYPHLNSSRNVYEIDRDRLSCAGGTAALDLLHAIIASDFGDDLANYVSEWYIQPEVRPGYISQLTSLESKLGASHPSLLAVVAEMERHYETPRPRIELAKLAGCSVRQLDRLFTRHLGVSVAGYYLRIRLNRARHLLMHTSMRAIDVAIACGFISSSNFSRTYRNRFGISPRDEQKGAWQRHRALS